ncbi:MAG: methylated-DNA--[protein]-cysteine S-methyltransferase [Deltaproteobacteria bacterium]|nr:methylated-DNA--[protein]-cysteine S-methyltransferase [Deltaproteobacteria bacterium]
MYYTTRYESMLGSMILASDGSKLVGLWYEGQKYFAATLDGNVAEKAELSIFAETKNWLCAYFAGKKPAISELPLAPSGNAFRQSVWGKLCEIPYGTCITYSSIAKDSAKVMNKKSMSSQAIGGAVGHNPISVIIPCHRVVGSKGNLTGYAGGIDKKIKLLAHEGVDTSKLSIPGKGTAL